ncbi:hypothetical protein C0J52_12696 [Blattella germanica]|nr:hypothetical protein C0J52_12696 [Blattella germanica]
MDIFHLLIILAKYISPTPDSPGLCKNHSMAYIDALATGKSWAVKMQDSTAKLQAGILTGNFHSLGSYDECISIQEVENPWGNIEGQYCLATFKLQNDTTGDDVESIFQEVISQEEYINIGVGAILAKGLRWGFCIPTSCTSENLRTHLTDYLGANGHINVDVQTPDCRSYNIDSRYICRLNIFVFLIATSILILVIISILNRCIFRESWRALYEYIASNYNGLTFLNNEQSVGNLPSLDGIKALSLIWLLIGQSYLLTASLPAINYISIIENMSKWPYMLLLKTQLVADSFLVCGGALASYHFHRDMVQRKKLIYTTNGYYSTGITWKYFFIYSLKYDFHRIIRLFPTLSITVILYNIYISYDKSGPLSYPANSWHEDICWSNLHRTLLFIANLIDGQNICLQSTWYIMVDLQLHLLSPFILFLLIKYKSRHCCAISIVVSGILFNIFIKYRELPTYFSDSKCKTKYNIYDVATKTKFSSWLIGIILGYLLFHFKATNEYPEIKWVTINFINFTTSQLRVSFCLFNEIPPFLPIIHQASPSSYVHSSVLR